MNLGSKGIELIKKYEGCRLTAYKAIETEEFWTIGWGHYGADVKEGQTITQEEADRMFLEDVKVYANAVEKYQDKYNFTQNQFDALTSFAYNCGVGSLANVMACCNTKEEIAEECKLYNKGAGVVLPGLVRRREEEYQLFMSDMGSEEVSSQEANTNVDTYTVKAGDNLSSIAAKYNTTVEKLASINNIINPNIINIGQVLKLKVEASRNIKIYTVAAGDNLSSIASRFNTTVAEICRLNNISNPNMIYAGQVLKLSGAADSPVYYTVKAGDTLSDIAAAYGTTWQAISELNGLSNPDLIYAGQKLRVK